MREQNRFMISAVVLLVLAFIAPHLDRPYYVSGVGIAPINAYGLLALGLAVAAGLALVADAIREWREPSERQ